jgi:hypothetical protein
VTAPADPVLGRALAYAGQRAYDRKTIKDAVAHAVWELTLATGLPLPDAECGKLGYIPLGEWDPDYGHNCPDCAAVLAGAALPEVPREAEPAPPARTAEEQVAKVLAWLRRLGHRRVVSEDQPDLFGAA